MDGRGDSLDQLRLAFGFRDAGPRPCMDDAAAYFPVNSVVRRLHAELPSVLIGGLATLFFQMLHPIAMAGVSKHSESARHARDQILRSRHAESRRNDEYRWTTEVALSLFPPCAYAILSPPRHQGLAPSDLGRVVANTCVTLDFRIPNVAPIRGFSEPSRPTSTSPTE